MHKCSFGRSSERLLKLAANYVQVSASSTDYRNLSSLQSYTVLEKAPEEAREFLKELVGEPYSFWIENVKWDDDYVLNLVDHLNFYMTYYDTKSPEILIHSPKSEVEAAQPQARFKDGVFPARILGKDLDDNLLNFWRAARTGDPARRFLYYYRIIEYAAAFYLDAPARMAVRKVLSTPNALDDVQRATERVLAAIQKSKIDDPQKIEAILRDTVEPGLLWQEIERNQGVFTVGHVFDGGFNIQSLIAPGAREVDFTANWSSTFTKAIRDIRNALAHGRDQRTAAVITPTTRNFERLEPWCL